MAAAAFSLDKELPESSSLTKGPRLPSTTRLCLHPSVNANIDTATEACSLRTSILESMRCTKYPISPSLATKIAFLSSSVRSWMRESRALRLKSVLPICSLAKRSLIKKTTSSLLAPGPGHERTMALDCLKTPLFIRRSRSCKCKLSLVATTSRSLCINNFPLYDRSVHCFASSLACCRVEYTLGKSSFMRSFSVQ
eukprot:Gb_11309 [translate_table: standard]